MVYASILAVIFGTALLVFPFLAERSRKPVDRVDRKQAEGKFAKLSGGLTHYRWSGGGRGPVIVAVHGLTTPSVIWSALIPSLTALGFRVLSYDLYGRGYSDAPRGRQTLAFFTRQLDELLADQGIAEEITLLGYSMGGSIVTAFAAEQPHRVARVLLIASAGIEMNETKLDIFCRKVPLLGDWAHGFIVGRQMRKSLKSKPAAIAEAQGFQLSRRGYLPAVLSSRRHALAARQEVAHRKLGHDDVPVFAFWAREDTTIPLSALGTLAQWNRATRQEDIALADHALPFSHAEDLAEKIKFVLREKQ